MIKRLPKKPKQPVTRTVDNIAEWYADFLDEEETTAEELESFARIADVDAEFTEMLATDYLAMTTMLVQHENTTPATLAYLVEVISEDWEEAQYVMQALADNARSTAEILEAVFSHGDRYAREAVVRHPNASTDILIRAARDKKENVRAELLDNNTAPNEALLYLSAHDPKDYIRALAGEQLRNR